MPFLKGNHKFQITNKFQAQMFKILFTFLSFDEFGVLAGCVYAVADVFNLADQDWEAVFNCP
jgi:hypothetical protein